MNSTSRFALVAGVLVAAALAPATVSAVDDEGAQTATTIVTETSEVDVTRPVTSVETDKSTVTTQVAKEVDTDNDGDDDDDSDKTGLWGLLGLLGLAGLAGLAKKKRDDTGYSTSRTVSADTQPRGSSSPDR